MAKSSPFNDLRRLQKTMPAVVTLKLSGPVDAYARTDYERAYKEWLANTIACLERHCGVASIELLCLACPRWP